MSSVEPNIANEMQQSHEELQSLHASNSAVDRISSELEPLHKAKTNDVVKQENVGEVGHSTTDAGMTSLPSLDNLVIDDPSNPTTITTIVKSTESSPEKQTTSSNISNSLGEIYSARKENETVNITTLPAAETQSAPDNVEQKYKTSKLEEETETVHLHPSPNDAMKIQNSLQKNTESIESPSVQQLGTELEQKIQAYAMLDFESFTFYVQTMQILLGRMVEGDSLTESLDIHLGNQKAISRRHAKIFYNFGNQRFELSVLGRNGAFVDGNFVEKGLTVPLGDGAKIQIGETEFAFVLPQREGEQSNNNNVASKLEDKLEGNIEVKPKVEYEKDIHLENLDNLVANFDEIKKDIQDNDILLKDPNVLNIVFDPEYERKRELEIEREIGRVLARENSVQPPDVPDPIDTNKNKSKKKSTPSSNSKSKPKSEAAPEAEKPKPKRQSKAKKKVYTLEEIPEPYRTKPNIAYSIMITECLRKKGTERGMSLSEIYKGIQELYPYYFYCPDGWQSSVRHNLSLNKSFRKISKEGKGWLWGVNEEVVAEKDRIRQKQLENAKAKAKLSQKIISKNSSSSTKMSSQGMTTSFSAKPSNLSLSSSSLNKTSMSNAQNLQGSSKQSSAGKNTNSPISKDSNMSANTKKALTYLQKELISLTKSRKMYDRATSTEILTKALAMTISQVDQAAKNFAIKGFPLVTLIDKNPGHVTKILTAALNAATLQVCKQKGLTPHLPPKITNSQGTQATTGSASASTSAPVSSTSTPNNSNGASNSKNTPTINSAIKIQAKPQQNKPVIAIKREEGSNPPRPVKPDLGKPKFFKPDLSKDTKSSGPVIYQFPKTMTKPQFKATQPMKPSFKPSVKPINAGLSTGSTGGINSMKPIKLGGNITNNTGLMKPQFYTKSKIHERNLNKIENNDLAIKKSIAKFGKPTSMNSGNIDTKISASEGEQKSGNAETSTTTVAVQRNDSECGLSTVTGDIMSRVSTSTSAIVGGNSDTSLDSETIKTSHSDSNSNNNIVVKDEIEEEGEDELDMMLADLENRNKDESDDNNTDDETSKKRIASETEEPENKKIRLD